MQKAAVQLKIWSGTGTLITVPQPLGVTSTYYFTFAYLPLLGHRPPTRFLQPALSWASCYSWPQVCPILFMSASRSCCQLFLGLPLFLFLWGFHRRACLVVLVAGLRNVRQIHFQRRFKISWSAVFWFVCCRSSPLLIKAGKRNLSILLRQSLRKVWILFFVATVVSCFCSVQKDRLDIAV